MAVSPRRSDDEADETEPSPVAWLDAPPAFDDQTLVVVTEALLPLALFHDVVVRRVVEEKPSVMERFMIEVALEIGEVTVEDMDELLALPAEATERVAAELCDRGVLVPEADGGGFRVVEEAAHAVLDREVLISYREDRMTFVVLPRSGDVLAYEKKRGPRPPLVERLHAVSHAPVPEPFRSTPLAQVLGAYVRDGRVSGLPDDVVDVVALAQDDPWRHECPVYRGTGRVWRRRASPDSPDGVRAEVTLYGDRGDDRTKMDLPEAGGIVDHWLDQRDLLADPEIGDQAWEALGLEDARSGRRGRIHRRGPLEWVFVVDGDEAQILVDEGRSVGGGGGLEITGPEGTTKTAVAVRLSPGDRHALLVLALEDAVDQVIEHGDMLTPTDVTEAVADAGRAFGLDRPVGTEAEVRQRLWRRGRHDLVYRLRAAEDFAYG